MNDKKLIFPTASITQKPATAMEVMAWREMNRGKLRGFISLRLASGMIIHDFTLFEKDGGERWLSLPAKSYQTPAGETKYQPVVEFISQTVASRFKKEAMDAVTRYFAEHETALKGRDDDQAIDDAESLR